MPANPLEARVLEVEHSPFTKKPEIETSRPTQTGRFLVCVAADARRCCDSTRTRSFPRWREVLTCVAVPLRRKCRSRLLTSKTTATVTWLDRKGNPRGGAHGSAASRVLRGRAAKPPGEERGRRSSRQTSLLDPDGHLVHFPQTPCGRVRKLGKTRVCRPRNPQVGERAVESRSGSSFSDYPQARASLYLGDAKTNFLSTFISEGSDSALGSAGAVACGVLRLLPAGARVRVRAGRRSVAGGLLGCT